MFDALRKGRKIEYSRMRYLSFFTGAMGLDLGLEMAGWECLGANELDPVACKTIKANRPRIPLLQQDICTLDRLAVRDAFGTAKIDAIVGGPPCQSFSTAGRRGSLQSPHGNAFLHFLELATSLDPQFIVIENVRGILSAPLQHVPHKERSGVLASDQHRRGSAFALILSTLEERGYHVSFNLYDTSLYGIPQKRERMVLIASQTDSLPHLVPLDRPAITFREATAGLGSDQDYLPLRPGQRDYLQHLLPGQNWRDLPPIMQAKALGKAYYCSGGRTGFLRRLDWDAPSPTLVTNPTMPATLLAHPTELRPLSIQEYLRLQTFPDRFVVCGSLALQYRQIGNAVPVEFGRRIGAHIAAWRSGRKFIQTKVKTSRYKNCGEQAWLT